MVKGSGNITQNKKHSKFWDKKIFDSPLKSPYVGYKEAIFGYWIGPMGSFALNGLMVNYLNPYYTDVLKLGQVWNGNFLLLFPLLSCLVVVFFDILFGYLIGRTHTSRGKARPFIFISAFLLAISGILCFCVPETPSWLELTWIIISYNLYYSVAFSMYSTAHSSMVPLSTRDPVKRSLLSTMANSSQLFMLGFFGGLLFPTFIYPFLTINKTAWMIAMGVFSAIALPTTIVEFYFTKERITEEETSLHLQSEKVHFTKQIAGALKDHYWWLLVAFFILYYASNSMRNASFLYYCNWVLGKYADGVTPGLMSAIGGIPMFFGMFIISQMTKKFKKNQMMGIGFAVMFLADLISFFFPNNYYVVLACFALSNIGGIPSGYLLLSLVSDVLDHLEWKNRFRSDGLTMSLYACMNLIFPIIAVAIFNKLLTNCGYVPPVENQVTVQNPETKSMISGIYFGVHGISSLLLVFILLFLNIEKRLPQEQKDILERQKAAVLASGGVWEDPEVKAKKEQKVLDAIQEESRLNDLKNKCAKNGKSFDKEEAKYETRVAFINKWAIRFKIKDAPKDVKKE
jgi:GPH family glycoside/pentoside/hexuronide:cation symporter